MELKNIEGLSYFWKKSNKAKFKPAINASSSDVSSSSPNLSIEDEFLEEIASKTKSVKFGPRYATIDITNRCNLNCIVCWTYSPFLKKGRPDDKWFIRELSFETIVRLIEDLKKLGTKEIRLTGGGEPFIHPKIMDIIRLIKSNGIKLDITTNFTLLDQEKINEIVGLGVDNLTISLWAATEDTYMRTHPIAKKGAFSRITKNLKLLNRIKKSRTTVVIANVLTNLNYHEAYDMVNYAKDVKADNIYFTLMDLVPETSSFLLKDKDQEELIRIFRRIIKDYDAKKFSSLVIDNPENLLRRIDSRSITNGEYDKNIIYEIPCTAGYTFTRILADGNVVPCCKAVMIPSGNINNEKFGSIWNGTSQMRFREIGFDLKNNPDFVEKVGCQKTCDNLMQNKEIYDRLKKLH